ncbi:hypothetical protein [Trichocoleus sp. FACHB-90]|nr:hypothetical protein [Trichocoleus sp. FACHB-90]
MRAKIILRAATGEGHGEIARGLGISRDMSQVMATPMARAFRA